MTFWIILGSVYLLVGFVRWLYEAGLPPKDGPLEIRRPSAMVLWIVLWPLFVGVQIGMDVALKFRKRNNRNK